MGRILAIDFGLKRTGIAVSDSLKIIASGLTTVNSSDLLPFLKRYVSQEEVECFVIGAPKKLDNRPSDIEKDIKGLIQILNTEFPKLPIHRMDERFTSKLAVQAMIEGGLKKKKRQRKELVDEISATLILQSFMKANEK